MKILQSIPYPTYTTVERDALTGVLDNFKINNSTTNRVEEWDGSAWISGVAASNVSLTPVAGFVADDVQEFAGEVANRMLVNTAEDPTSSLKFDRNYWPDETRQIDLANGNVTLSLNVGVSNIVGNSNFFDLIADGVHSINLGTGFKTNGIFPSTISGTILDAGSYLVACIYSPNGIVISIPALGGTATIDTPPTASTVFFTGQPVVGTTMTGWYKYADNDDDIENGTTFKWYRSDNNSGLNRVAISGATLKSYVIQAADQNKYLQFGVTVKNSKGTGIEVLTAYSQQVTLTDTFAPTIQLASIENVTPATLKLVFSETVTATNLGYTVKVNTVTNPIVSLVVVANEIIIQLTKSVQNGEIVTLDYDSAIGNTVDGNANELVSFTGMEIVNNVLTSPISAVPYNADLTNFFDQNNLVLDEISGRVKQINNLIDSSKPILFSSTDAQRATVNANGSINTLQAYIKGATGQYNFSLNTGFTYVFVGDFGALFRTGVRLITKSLFDGFLYNNSQLVYVNGGLTEFYMSVNFSLHRNIWVLTYDGTNLKLYAKKDYATPKITKAATLSNNLIACLLSSTTEDGFAGSNVSGFQETLTFNRVLSTAELNTVCNDYLSNKYVDFQNAITINSITHDIVTTIALGATVTLTKNITGDYDSLWIYETDGYSVTAGSVPLQIASTESSFVLDAGHFVTGTARKLAYIATKNGVPSNHYVGSVGFIITA